MRIILNRNERAMIEEQAKSHADKVMFCQMGLVVNQPMEKISSWAQKLATPETVMKIHSCGVMPIIMGPRPEAAALEPEPGMGNIMVVSLPPSSDIEATEQMKASVLYQRMADFYGPGVMAELHDAADFLDEEGLYATITKTEDLDTPLAIVLRAPTKEESASTEDYQQYLDAVFTELFNYIEQVETGALSFMGEDYTDKLPPRSLDRRLVVDGKPVVARVCGLGYDIEILLNGGVARDDDETMVIEFWNAFQSYLDRRPTDPAAFKGFWQPSEDEVGEPVDLPTVAAND